MTAEDAGYQELGRQGATWREVANGIAFLPLAVFAGWYAAWVLSWFWLWFVTPLGVPAVSSLHMFGIYLGVRFAVVPQTDQRVDWKRELQRLPVALLFTSAVLLVGWIIKELM